ncbi:MAG TPA: hypothetical protein VFT34_07760 [Verrucomicrobiae bacterium]|nr:hypothetical protein [Verrucomicrobiae bacterium]
MTRSQKKSLIITGIVMALPVLFLVEEHFRGKWALGKLKRQLVAKGEKLAVNECRPAAPETVAENGCAELVRAAAMLGGGSLAYLAPRSLRAVAPGRVEVIHGLTEWKVSNANRRNATNNNWRALEESFAAWRDPLADVKVAIRRPAFDAKVDYARGFEAPVPHLTRLRSAAQHLGIDALIQLHNGRLDEAVDDIEAQLFLSHQMRNERLLISQLVRIAIAANAIGPTWQALQTPGLTDAQLARLQRAWETNEFVVGMNQSLEMERAMAVAMFARMRGSVDDAAKMMDAMTSWSSFGTTGGIGPVQSFDEWVEQIGAGGGRVLMRGLYLPVWQFAWSHQDEKFYLEAMQDVLEGGREAVRRYSVAPVSRVSKLLENRWENQSSYSRISRHLSEQLAASKARSLERAISFEAQRTLTITAIALKRHELRHGSAAATLAALVPEFLREIPRDIFDGQPLRYRPGEGGSYLLYSIGKDERDDGGDPVPPNKGSRNFYFLFGRDWVWPMPATQEDIRAAEEKENQKK